MSTFRIYVQCAGCHKVLPPIRWDRASAGDYSDEVGTQVDDLAEAHALTCPGRPLTYDESIEQAIAYWRDRAASFGIPFSTEGEPHE